MRTPTRFPELHELRRFSAAEYERIVDLDILREEEELELLDGFLIHKTPATPAHDAAVSNLGGRLVNLVPDRCFVQRQARMNLPDSRLAPDAVIFGGPEAGVISLVAEVADAGLQFDRVDKGRIYARVSIPQYWVVNLVDRQIEVYTDPTGPVSVPVYRRRQDYPVGATVPVELDGTAVGTVSVDEVLP